MLTIFKRECKRLFASPVTLAVLFLWLLASGILATLFHLQMQLADISYSLRILILPTILLLPIPFLRLRIKDTDRDDTAYLASLPLSHVSIVLGKFAAALLLLMIPTLFLSLIPPILSSFGTVNFPTAYLSILGFFLCAAFLAALVQVLLSLFKRPLVAALVTYAVVLVLGFWGTVLQALPIPAEIANALTSYDPLAVFEIFTHGHLPTGGVLYFLSLTALLTVCSILILRRARGEWGSRRGRISAIRLSAIALLLTLACNIGAAHLPYRAALIDMTGYDVFSLSGKTKDALHALDTDVTLSYFCAGGKAAVDSDLYGMLEAYADESDHIKLRVVDTEQDPTAAAAYGRTSLSDHSIVAEARGRYYVVDYSDLFYYYNETIGQAFTQSQYTNCLLAYSTYMETGSYGNYDATLVSYGEMLYTNAATTTAYFDGDAQLINAVRYATSADVKTVYLHGGSVNSLDLFSEYLIGRGYFIKTLASLEKIPADCSLLLLYALEEDLTETELGAVMSYTNAGGDILLATSCVAPSMPHLASLTGSYGLGFLEQTHIVCEKDTASGSYAESFYAAVAEQPFGAFDGQFVLLMPHAITVTEYAGVTAHSWITSTENAMLKLPGEDENYLADSTASYTCGAVAERQGSTLLWLSSTLSLGSYGYSYSSGGNYTLMGTAIDATCGASYEALAIDARAIPSVSIALTDGTVSIWTLILCVLLPLLFTLPPVIRLYIRRRGG